MKKVLCPKCDNDITFNEDRYEKNVSLFFVCPYCGKQFNVSVADLKNDQEISDCGFIVVFGTFIRISSRTSSFYGR